MNKRSSSSDLNTDTSWCFLHFHKKFCRFSVIRRQKTFPRTFRHVLPENTDRDCLCHTITSIFRCLATSRSHGLHQRQQWGQNGPGGEEDRISGEGPKIFPESDLDPCLKNRSSSWKEMSTFLHDKQTTWSALNLQESDAETDSCEETWTEEEISGKR